jgi:hypothetical protein
MTAITTDTTVQRAGDFVTATVDDALVMMSLEKGAYYGLDDIGSQIWEMLDEPTRVDALCDALMARYDVSRAQCEEDVLAFLQDLLDEGMVSIVPAEG